MFWLLKNDTNETLNYLVIEEEENPNRYKSRGISNEFLSDNVAVKVLEKSTIIAQDMAIQICQVTRKTYEGFYSIKKQLIGEKEIPTYSISFS